MEMPEVWVTQGLSHARKIASVAFPVAKSSLSALAEICGVSTSTVSRALSGHPAVQRDTREQIIAAARKHGYNRNDLVGKLMGNVIGLGLYLFDADSMF